MFARALRLLVPFLAAVATLTSHAAWPDASKPIRVVVGFPPAAAPMRACAGRCARAVGQLKANVIIDNRPGAGGLIATELVAKSAPDGYTLYVATPGSFTIWPNLRKLNYDPQKDFAPISVLVTMPNVLVTGADAPYKDVQGMVAALRSANGKFSYASGGNGTIGQIAAEQFKMLTGLQMQHVAVQGHYTCANRCDGRHRADYVLGSVGEAADRIRQAASAGA